MNKVATRSSTKERVSHSARRKKNSSKGNRRIRKEPDTESDAQPTVRIPVESVPLVELEKGVGPNRLDRDISKEVREQLVDPGEIQTLRRVRFDDQPVILQPDPRIRVD